MRYWGILVAKLIAGAGILYAIWQALYHLYPFPAYYLTSKQGPFLHDFPWTTREAGLQGGSHSTQRKILTAIRSTSKLGDQVSDEFILQC